MKHAILKILSVALLLRCSSYKEEESSYFTDFAFASCFRNALPDSIRTDLDKVDYTTQMLIDVGELWSYFEGIDSLAINHVKTIGSSQIDDNRERRLLIYECLEFSRSPEVLSLVRKFGGKNK